MDRHPDDAVFFNQSVETKTECVEICLNVRPRDVYQAKRNGVKEWKLSDKPKRRAEVKFRQLGDDDKLQFLGAMKNEWNSYLEHEAVNIASRHGVPKSRIMGMRWVLNWKRVEDEAGNHVGDKPKARLIIKGYQDPDLLKAEER